MTAAKAKCPASTAVLQQVFGTLPEDAGLTENPFSAVPKLQRTPQCREAFSADELKRIGEASRSDPFLYPLFAIAAYTGLREGDICTLKWSEVSYETGTITRRMRKTGKRVTDLLQRAS